MIAICINGKLVLNVGDVECGGDAIAFALQDADFIKAIGDKTVMRIVPVTDNYINFVVE